MVLSYLGQEDVKLLDWNLAGQKAAGLPVAVSDDERPGFEYMPEVNS
jgi:3-mercaptopyruvate sulfurtransferase SseA